MIKFLFAFLVFSISLFGGIQELEKITDCPSIGWIQQRERWTFENWMENKREEIVPHFVEIGFRSPHGGEIFLTPFIVSFSLSSLTLINLKVCKATFHIFGSTLLS